MSFVKICLSVPSTHVYKGVLVLDETTFKFTAKFDAQEKNQMVSLKRTVCNLSAKNSQAHLNSAKFDAHKNKWCHWKEQCLTYLYAKNSQVHLNSAKFDGQKNIEKNNV